MPPDLQMRLGPLTLSNPVICGAGEHVASRESLMAAIDAGAAAVIAKSANETEAGRQQSEVAESTFLDGVHEVAEPSNAASIFNRSGLVPEAWETWLQTLAEADRHAAERHAFVAASLIPGDERELPHLAAEVEAAGLRWLELNLSAPHAGEAQPGAIERPTDPARAASLTRSVRRAASIALTVKLSAEHADLVGLARAVYEAGADAVVLTGRHMGFLPDLRTRRPVLGTFGAVSGPWSLPLALRWVAKTRRALGPDLPVVGSGGIRSGGDVARFLLSGATAAQIATAVIVEGYGAIGRILSELEDYLEGQGLDAREIVGEAADAALTYQEARAVHD
jgi:dihydroorotate dehydrogenase